jgi:hypothetical protein
MSQVQWGVRLMLLNGGVRMDSQRRLASQVSGFEPRIVSYVRGGRR